MKNKILTAISTIMLIAPWTLIFLRRFDWALESPMAENLILGYAIFMIISGIFTLIAYFGGEARNNLMKINLIVNSLYGIVGIAIIVLFQFPDILQIVS